MATSLFDDPRIGSKTRILCKRNQLPIRMQEGGGRCVCTKPEHCVYSGRYVAEGDPNTTHESHLPKATHVTPPKTLKRRKLRDR